MQELTANDRVEVASPTDRRNTCIYRSADVSKSNVFRGLSFT